MHIYMYIYTYIYRGMHAFFAAVASDSIYIYIHTYIHIYIYTHIYRGMHAFFAAVASDRFNVAFPLIGVQDFARAVRESNFQARVDTIRPPFEHASGAIEP
jgi:hypothetical protein